GEVAQEGASDVVEARQGRLRRTRERPYRKSRTTWPSRVCRAGFDARRLGAAREKGRPGGDRSVLPSHRPRGRARGTSNGRGQGPRERDRADGLRGRRAYSASSTGPPTNNSSTITS